MTPGRRDALAGIACCAIRFERLFYSDKEDMQ